LQQLFGISKVLWIDHGYLAGDDTDGHIDTLARFVDTHTICYVRCHDENDEHYPALKAMENQLRTFTDYQGNPYRLIPLPWPKAQTTTSYLCKFFDYQ
jgi:agmatine deiminase